MAARVMPFGGGFEIVLSQHAHDICVEKGYTALGFEELPECELKGFEGLHSVYKLKWREAQESAKEVSDGEEGAHAPHSAEHEDAASSSDADPESLPKWYRKEGRSGFS